MSGSPDEEIRILRARFWSARDPDGRAFAPLADAYRRSGDLDEAESLIEDGLGRLPDFATGHLVAGLVRRDQGRLDEALACMDRVLELDPDNVAGRVERAEAALRLGDRESARRDLERVLELDPSDGQAVVLLDEVERGEGAAEAPAEAEPATEPGPDADDGPVYTRTLGELYVKQGFPDRAIEVYEHLLSRDPDNEELARRLEELKGGQAEGAPPAAGAEPAVEAAPPEEAASGPEARSRPGAEPEVGPEEDAEPEPGQTAPQWVAEEADASDRGLESVFTSTDPDSEVGPGAGPEAGGPTGPTIGSYFQELLSWIPGAVPIESLAPDGAGAATETPEAPAPGEAAPPPEPPSPPAEAAAPSAPAVPDEAAAPAEPPAPGEPAPRSPRPEEAVPIESLAPDPNPGGDAPPEDEGDNFDDWLQSVSD